MGYIGDNKLPKGYVIDHIDGDTSNNRRKNLRLITDFFRQNEETMER
jgi:hypothetical protein